jgi:tRNA pseudouridine38-40 synthase
MQRFLLTLQYLGTRYAGWQMQANATGVQQVIEAAMEELCGSHVTIEASGRTDAGVHARAQRAHADIPISIPPLGLVKGINNLLPHDIRLVAAEPVAPDFHARFHVVEKTYVYNIWNHQVRDVFHHETFAHVREPLDVARMQQGAQMLIGHHDFKAFTVTEPEVRSTWRMLRRLDISRNGDEIRIEATANGFLRYMVRRLAGSLIELGKGRIEALDVVGSLEPHYAEARWTAPAHGLVLEDVSYAELPA